MNDIRLYVTLGSTPHDAQAAIDRLDQALARWNWGSAGSRADARLVIKELIDDALEHAGLAPDISLELARSGHRLRIEVTDNSPGDPHSRFVEATGHHGLNVVQSLASQWGTAIHPHGGTTVWCELINIPEPRRPAPSETFGIAA
jgi:signal transduction histidine kinase